MGAMLRAAVETGRVAVRQPRVIAATLVTGVLAPVLAVLSGLLPFVGGVVYALVVHPILLAGLLHVGSTAVEESVGLGTYVAGIRSHYFGLLKATLLTGTIFVPLGWLAVVIIFTTGFTGVAGINAGLVVVLALFMVMGVGLQFIDASVVVDGDGASGAVEHSWEALAHHPVSVLGYTLVRVLSLGVVAGAVAVFVRGGKLGFDAPNAPGTGTLAAALVLGLVGYLVGGVFHALFYRELTDATLQTDVSQ